MDQIPRVAIPMFGTHRKSLVIERLRVSHEYRGDGDNRYHWWHELDDNAGKAIGEPTGFTMRDDEMWVY